MNKPRNKWIALGLTIAAPGLGHIYCGQLNKGILLTISVTFLFLLWSAISVIFLENLFVILFGILFIIFLISIAVSAFKTAKRISDYALKKYNRVYIYALYVCIVFVLGYSDNLISIVHKVPSQSMESTIIAGEFVLCNKMIYWYSEPKRNDLAVFIVPTDGVTMYLMRIVAIEYDTVLIKDKILFINGVEQPLPATVKYTDTIHRGETTRDNFGPFVVPANSYFMLGDNRDNSYDSRYWGVVPRENILYKAVQIDWSEDLDRWLKVLE